MTVIESAGPSRAATVDLIADDLALNFANTESGRGFPSHQDHLQNPDNVPAWLAHAGALSASAAEALAARVSRAPALGAELLTEARGLRASVHAIGAAIAHRVAPPRDALAALSAIHARCLECAALDLSEGRGSWRWTAGEAPIEAALGPIALAAVRLVTEGDPERIRECGGQACGWLFYDISKNNRRRWCEMEVCGNRAKQRRHAERHKGR